MPSFVTCPFIQNQSTHGRAESGGSRKDASRSPGEPAARAARGTAYATTPAATVPLRKSRRDMSSPPRRGQSVFAVGGTGKPRLRMSASIPASRPRKAR